MEEIEIDLSNLAPLGQGSFCGVHLVEIDGRQIAVKTLKYKRHTPNYDRLLPDFKKECEILVELNHPNIITTICGSEKVLKYEQLQFGILTEYCEKGTLRELIFDANFLYSMQNVTVWSENLFDALDYIFKSKHIHRDIKTDNIFVTKSFIVKLGDFGTTKEIDATCTGTFDVGTPRYLSPPQIDPNQTNEELLEQSRTVHEINCEKLVFAEYGTEGKFDHGRFTLDVVFGKLEGLEPPKCLQEFREIVEACCNFDRSKRPDIEETLKRIQKFRKVNNLNGSNDAYPAINKNQQELIRPIGFNQLENPNLIPVTFPFEFFENQGHMLIKKWKNDSWLKSDLRDEFIKRFDEMSNHEKMDFIKQMKDIKVDAIKKNYKYFHEYPGFGNLEKDCHQMDIRQIFEEIVLANQNFKMDVLRRYLKKHSENSMSGSTKFLPCLLLIGMREVDALIDRAKDIPFSNLKFKCFLSLRTGEEWILIDTPGNSYGSSYYFLSKSFDKYLSLKKEKPTEDKSVFYSDDDELHYLDDFIIKITAFVQLLDRAKLKLQTRITLDFCLSKIQHSEITQGIEKNLPIEGCLFQLNNPPRIQCNHEPKCDVKMQVSKNGDIKILFYSCSSERQNNYLSFWIEFVSRLNFLMFFDLYLFRLEEVHLFVNPIQEPSNSDPIVFLQVIDFSCSSIEYITLLDFSEQYFNGPSVPYLDSHNVICFMDGRILQKSLNETPKNKRKYWLVTRIEIKSKSEWEIPEVVFE